MSDLHLLPKHATLLLNPLPKLQTKDDVHAAIDEVLKRSGCTHCGAVSRVKRNRGLMNGS
jgi:hypothetical protein